MVTRFVRALFLALGPALVQASPSACPIPAPAQAPVPDPVAQGLEALEAGFRGDFFNYLDHDVFVRVDRQGLEDEAKVYHRVGDEGPIGVIAGMEFGRILVPPLGSLQLAVAMGARPVAIIIESADGRLVEERRLGRDEAAGPQR